MTVFVHYIRSVYEHFLNTLLRQYYCYTVTVLFSGCCLHMYRLHPASVQLCRYCTVVQYFVCTYIFQNFSHAYLDVLWSVFICACYNHAEMAEPIEVPFGATWRIRLICVVDCDMPLPRITVVNCAIWHNLVRVLHCYTTL